MGEVVGRVMSVRVDIPKRLQVLADTGFLGKFPEGAPEIVIQRVGGGRGNYVRRDGVVVQVRRYVGTQLPVSQEAEFRRLRMAAAAINYRSGTGNPLVQLAWLAWVVMSSDFRRELCVGDWTTNPQVPLNYYRAYNHAWQWFSAGVLRFPLVLPPSNVPIIFLSRMVGFQERWPTPFDLNSCYLGIADGIVDPAPLDDEYARVRGTDYIRGTPRPPWELYPEFIIGTAG